MGWESAHHYISLIKCIIQSIKGYFKKNAWFVNCTNQVTMERDVKQVLKTNRARLSIDSQPALCTQTNFDKKKEYLGKSNWSQ